MSAVLVVRSAVLPEAAAAAVLVSVSAVSAERVSQAGTLVHRPEESVPMVEAAAAAVEKRGTSLPVVLVARVDLVFC